MILVPDPVSASVAIFCYERSCEQERAMHQCERFIARCEQTRPGSSPKVSSRSFSLTHRSPRQNSKFYEICRWRHHVCETCVAQISVEGTCFSSSQKLFPSPSTKTSSHITSRNNPAPSYSPSKDETDSSPGRPRMTNNLPTRPKSLS